MHFPVKLESNEFDEQFIAADNLLELGQELEFHDEFSGVPVIASTVEGKYVRLIVSRLEVLLFRLTKRMITATDLHIKKCHDQSERQGIAEVCIGEVHRVIWNDGSIEPFSANEFPARVELGDDDDLEPKVFNQRWVEKVFELKKDSGLT